LLELSEVSLSLKHIASFLSVERHHA